MGNGRFVVEVKAPRKRKYETLSVYEYDSASKQHSKRRWQTLEAVLGSIVGWSTRYSQSFREAAYQVREIRTDRNERKGKVINLTAELEKERGSRAAFQAALAKARWDAKEAEERKKAKANGTAHPVAKGAVAVRGTTKGTFVSRRTIRRTAKKLCKAKEGTTINWRNYL